MSFVTTNVIRRCQKPLDQSEHKHLKQLETLRLFSINQKEPLQILQARGSTRSRARVVNAEVALDSEIATDVDRTTLCAISIICGNVVAVCEVHLRRGLDEGMLFKRKTRPCQGPQAIHRELALEACSLREDQWCTQEQRGSSVES